MMRILPTQCVPLPILPSRIRFLWLLVFVPVLVAAVSVSAGAADLREAARKAAADRQAALHEAQEARARVLADSTTLAAEVTRLEDERERLEAELHALQNRTSTLTRERQQLAERWSQQELGFREISGNVRVVARDLETFLRHSLLTASAPHRLGPIEALLREGYFPDIDDISAMAAVFFDEIVRSGEVSLQRDATFVGRSGQERQGPVLILGPFLAVYRDGDEFGFLTYLPQEKSMTALAALPSRGVRRHLARYMAGRDDTVPIDLSGGAALRRIAQPTSLADQLRAGGPIVWPILLIALAALIMVIERFVFLNRVRGNTDRIMGQVNELAARGQWEDCGNLLQQEGRRAMPVINVIKAGLAGRGEDRETLESILQEAILRELPRLERFLSVLAVLGAVAPLLGLLGTVTGMIDTFRVITLHGTGDPRMMSGGISEALITTELGLAVAIPIMLLHTFLSRRVDHIVGEMEEKAVALTNTIQKEAKRDGATHAHL